ncbi:hypothetical protein [Arthrobacter sp. NPDC092385]|uniref:hypothetical protein n=1 Tax=Arthrobacter sp. NPDC092385 TaxID=3363943 RepID=UPI0037FB180C
MSRSETAVSDAKEPKQINLGLLLFLGVSVSTVAVLLTAYFLAAYETGSFGWWTQPGRITPDTSFSIIRNSVTLVAALGLAATLFLSYRRQQAAEKTLRLTADAQKIAADAQKTGVEVQKTAAAAQVTANKNYELANRNFALISEKHGLDVVAALRGRYVSAAEQLGNTSPAVRLAGIYALASLADDWSDKHNYKERQVCVDLLTSYLSLMQSASDASAPTHSERDTIWSSIFERVAVDRTNNGWPRAVVKVQNTRIAERLVKLDLDFKALDFSSSPVASLSFEDCHFISAEVRLDAAEEGASITFSHCQFISGLVVFDIGYYFGTGEETWTVNFIDCEFKGTRISLQGQTPRGGYSFTRCNFYEASPGFYGKPAASYLRFSQCRFFTDPLKVLHRSGLSVLSITEERTDWPGTILMTGY